MRFSFLLLLALSLLFMAVRGAEGEDAVAAEAGEASAGKSDALANEGAPAASAEEPFYEEEEEAEEEEEDLSLDEELSAHDGAGPADAQQELSPEQREMQMRLQQQMVRYVLETASATCSSELRSVLGMTQVRTWVTGCDFFCFCFVYASHEITHPLPRRCICISLCLTSQEQQQAQHKKTGGKMFSDTCTEEINNFAGSFTIFSVICMRLTRRPTPGHHLPPRPRRPFPLL